MNSKTCKDLNCPRLTEQDGQTYCNQQMPDTAPYWEDCSSVSHERCKELRRELKARREVQQ